MEQLQVERFFKVGGSAAVAQVLALPYTGRARQPAVAACSKIDNMADGADGTCLHVQVCAASRVAEVAR